MEDGMGHPSPVKGACRSIHTARGARLELHELPISKVEELMGNTGDKSTPPPYHYWLEEVAREQEKRSGN